MSMAEHFPLQWPYGFTRTERRKKAPFKCTVAKGRNDVFKQLKLMGIGNWNVIISSNAPLSIRTSEVVDPGRKLADPGVAVYFRKDDRPYVFACDKWDSLGDNLRALAMTIEAIRGLERWGVSDMLERTFQGFAALPPPPKASEKRKWWEVLQCDREDSPEFIQSQYKKLAKAAHPDQGGSHEKMAELNNAIEEMRTTWGNP